MAWPLLHFPGEITECRSRRPRHGNKVATPISTPHRPQTASAAISLLHRRRLEEKLICIVFMQLSESSLQEHGIPPHLLGNLASANQPGSWLKFSVVFSPQFAPCSKLVEPCMASITITNTSCKSKKCRALVHADESKTFLLHSCLMISLFCAPNPIGGPLPIQASCSSIHSPGGHYFQIFNLNIGSIASANYFEPRIAEMPCPCTVLRTCCGSILS